MSRELSEIREFAGFPACAARYIRRSLDVFHQDSEAMVRWSRSLAESESIAEQRILYKSLPTIQGFIPRDTELSRLDPFMSMLIKISVFDLSQQAISSFAEYRFLYERLLSVKIRMWLPSAFSCAAASPYINPNDRIDLLMSLKAEQVLTANWSERPVTFLPSWVDKVET